MLKPIKIIRPLVISIYNDDVRDNKFVPLSDFTSVQRLFDVIYFVAGDVMDEHISVLEEDIVFRCNVCGDYHGQGKCRSFNT